MAAIRRYALPAALLAALYFAVFGGEYSALEVRRMRAELREARAQMERVQADNDSLRALAEALESDAWLLEKLAREEHGLVKEGEEVIRILDRDRAARDSAAGGEGER
ncbi:MAG: septum formation initiator family protein [Longimicrobiales bacterium]|nr:septum formation initiator family protein [Longimicrobiales bacterium]